MTSSRREELNSLVRQYAEARRIPYNESWRQFAACFQRRYHAGLYVMKHSYCEDSARTMTMPEFLEETNWMDQALVIAREMSADAPF